MLGFLGILLCCYGAWGYHMSVVNKLDQKILDLNTQLENYRSYRNVK
jgi:hypothetical protein